MNARPPRLASWLLRRILDPRQREYILDDLAEDYGRRRGMAGLARTYFWYWSETVRSIRPSLNARANHKQDRYPHDGIQSMDIFFADLKQSARRLLKTPAFTVAAVVTLALGLGANVAIFTLVNGIVLRPLPYAEPERLVSIRHTAPGLGLDVMEMSMGTYVHFMANANLVESAGTADDDRVDTPSNVIISHALWQQHFGADPDIVGKLITLQGKAREIIGVMPAGFAYPSRGV